MKEYKDYSKFGNIAEISKKEFIEKIDGELIKEIKKSKYEKRKSCYGHITELYKGYKRLSKSRKINQIWHQSRLEVIPLAGFLNEINKKKDGNCEQCKERNR